MLNFYKLLPKLLLQGVKCCKKISFQVPPAMGPGQKCLNKTSHTVPGASEAALKAQRHDNLCSKMVTKT